MNANLQNGASNGNQTNAHDPPNEHWQWQLQLYSESRQHAQFPHHHCKRETATRTKDYPPTEEQLAAEASEERNRATATKIVRRHNWDAIDMSGQGLHALAAPLFGQYTFLTKLFLDNNRLTRIHPFIGQLKTLTHLDVSQNELLDLPSEIGMLVNLKNLLLFDNQIQDLPMEMGHLYKLEMLGIEGNPLNADMKNHIVKNSTQSLITTLRETRSGKPMLILLLRLGCSPLI